LAEAFSNVYGDSAKRETRLLYLSRAGSKLRSPLNEQGLEQALAERGAEIFTAADGNHPEQIARFRGADCIVSVHGAGLTNLVFARPGTRVIEIFPSNFVKSPYWRLARQLGLHYTPVIGGPGDYDQRFEVDVSAVMDAVQGGARTEA
jgi:capsular polysaccharide biosynthesis protein